MKTTLRWCLKNWPGLLITVSCSWLGYLGWAGVGTVWVAPMLALTAIIYCWLFAYTHNMAEEALKLARENLKLAMDISADASVDAARKEFIVGSYSGWDCGILEGDFGDGLMHHSMKKAKECGCHSCQRFVEQMEQMASQDEGEEWKK